jgi:hypothetical protein
MGYAGKKKERSIHIKERERIALVSKISREKRES